jgi:hypothetical protein
LVFVLNTAVEPGMLRAAGPSGLPRYAGVFVDRFVSKIITGA